MMTYALPDTLYAYPALTQFDVVSSNDTVSSIVYNSGLQNAGAPINGQISWTPTFTMNSGGSGSFVLVGIPSGSSANGSDPGKLESDRHADDDRHVFQSAG